MLVFTLGIGRWVVRIYKLISPKLLGSYQFRCLMIWIMGVCRGSSAPFQTVFSNPCVSCTRCTCSSCSWRMVYYRRGGTALSRSCVPAAQWLDTFVGCLSNNVFKRLIQRWASLAMVLRDWSLRLGRWAASCLWLGCSLLLLVRSRVILAMHSYSSGACGLVWFTDALMTTLKLWLVLLSLLARRFRRLSIAGYLARLSSLDGIWWSSTHDGCTVTRARRLSIACRCRSPAVQNWLVGLDERCFC